VHILADNDNTICNVLDFYKNPFNGVLDHSINKEIVAIDSFLKEID
jgi:hypothetical protein